MKKIFLAFAIILSIFMFGACKQEVQDVYVTSYGDTYDYVYTAAGIVNAYVDSKTAAAYTATMATVSWDECSSQTNSTFYSVDIFANKGDDELEIRLYFNKIDDKYIYSYGYVDGNYLDNADISVEGNISDKSFKLSVSGKNITGYGSEYNEETGEYEEVFRYTGIEMTSIPFTKM